MENFKKGERENLNVFLRNPPKKRRHGLRLDLPRSEIITFLGYRVIKSEIKPVLYSLADQQRRKKKEKITDTPNIAQWGETILGAVESLCVMSTVGSPIY